MSEKSKRLFEQAGIEKTKEIFLWVKPGESPNYPDSVEDNAHFSENGAKEIARLVVEGIQEHKNFNCNIVKYLLECKVYK